MVHRKRVEVVTDLIAEALEEGWDRERLKKEMYKRYEEHGISPLRGIALPPDILDKELATVYVISKYGLGLDEELRDLLEFERKLERAAEAILEKGKDAREQVTSELGPIDSNLLSRIFRVVFTSVVLGFKDEEELIRLLHRALETFPDMENTIRKYARFYVAFRVAEAIAKGEVRSRMEKEALKQSLALRVGLPKVIPDDNYIYKIAKEVFKIPEERLRKVLKVKEG
ncbi:DUF2192 domain-containing protein [Ignicoccus hospitalis]|uniref:Uncharacterized protein-like protein n=1 Tax=Ignicoccus hospitalis (strain KIN4/I / DSM 18386 / JCM 14125) TaxID=453591 RepID=A8AB01_IGNH4|nr:DUF2192 domain-containing protein [Ignicoccus hospitalis]ABU82103.1 Uncharacterized protein-like protein [Ignicoccus hospitalis KIN4/I]